MAAEDRESQFRAGRPGGRAGGAGGATERAGRRSGRAFGRVGLNWADFGPINWDDGRGAAAPASHRQRQSWLPAHLRRSCDARIWNLQDLPSLGI